MHEKKRLHIFHYSVFTGYVKSSSRILPHSILCINYRGSGTTTTRQKKSMPLCQAPPPPMFHFSFLETRRHPTFRTSAVRITRCKLPSQKSCLFLPIRKRLFPPRQPQLRRGRRIPYSPGRHYRGSQSQAYLVLALALLSIKITSQTNFICSYYSYTENRPRISCHQTSPVSSS